MPFTPVCNNSQDSLPPTGVKCATVTMMLAERMKCSEWSIEDEHFFDTNTMNVWQTIEFLSSVNLRKRYNYDGFSDAKNILSSLAPASWRRDSFTEKNPNEEAPNNEGKFAQDRTNNNGIEVDLMNANARPNTANDYTSQYGALSRREGKMKASQGQSGRSKSKRRSKKKGTEIVAEYALSQADLEDLVKCSFTLPRITARLERLMGTNVVRLTDRNYMKVLRERIDNDYREQLAKRIKARELKELERERILIIEGKTDAIPDELQDDPIFMVNRDANIEIQKTRSKLKTSREKHAERLKIQGMKWERERQRRAIEEAILLQKRKERQQRQKQVEEQYRLEDADRGMDLLRIDNDEWRECEIALKEFLECERERMKERSNRIPIQFASDPLDISNIVRARQKFHDTELKIRKELDEKCMKPFESENPPPELVQMLLDKTADVNTEVQEGDDKEEDFEDDVEKARKKYDDDASDVSISSELQEEISSLSVARQRHIELLKAELEEDIANGLLITKKQYDQLRFEEEKILALHDAKNICELYKLAEEIILGDRPPEEEEEENDEYHTDFPIENIDPESAA